MAQILTKEARALPMYLVGPDGEIINLACLLQQIIGASGTGGTSGVRDTTGGEVPVWKSRSFQYDNSGNLSSETITDGNNQWVRSYTYTNGSQVADSGWVKQGA